MVAVAGKAGWGAIGLLMPAGKVFIWKLRSILGKRDCDGGGIPQPLPQRALLPHRSEARKPSTDRHTAQRTQLLELVIG